MSDVRYSDLVRIDGHKNYYVNPKSKKITYKKGKIKFATGETQIMKAKKEVDKRLALMKGESEFSISQRQNKIISPLLSSVWTNFYDNKKSSLALNTKKNYLKNWRVVLEPFWGSKTLDQVNDESVLEYKNWYLEKFPKRDFEKAYYYLRLLFQDGLKYGLKAVPNMKPLEEIHEKVKSNARRVKVGRAYTESELKGFMLAVETLKDFQPVGEEKALELYSRARLGILLGSKCGCRKDEALGITWDNVDLEGKAVRVWSTKNGKWRTIPLVKELVSAFRFQKKVTITSKYVFPMPTDPNRHISSQIFDKVWVRVKEVSKIQGRARFHDLRHTFASKTAEDGWPPIVACDVLDMSLRIYQKVYCKVKEETKMRFMKETFGESYS